ncbi:HEPN domain-containing protein [Clostridium estertheticum]|uniref:HEPN domain-containing protein n=1 Tax=Clostridium estertheticum TaxID=238834 RepID=UPI00124DEFA5|nr:HEPN domain-containing protein [Clostridium estertheticum]MBZ9616798.1 hypothetical protein [Clostridium estertheticum subsp. laramiense]WAG72505.1 hypothetical protein LL032_15270 [Clostridium estertheticum]
MKNTYQNNFEINLGRHFILPSVNSNIIPIPELLGTDESELRAMIYSSLIDNFSNYTIASLEEEATIIADWTSLFNDGKNSNLLSIKIRLNTVKNINLEGQKNYLSYYVNAYLYELFFILNISIPGSITLYGATLNVDLIKTRFDMDDYFFGASLEWSNDVDWFKILYVPTKDVVKWYESLNIGIRQLSKTNLERVIFSLLHICSEKHSSLNGLVSLTHSLESLFGSPKNAISTTIINRSFKILGEPRQGSRKIKRMFNEFYDLRSRYVHGEYNIPHPSFNNILDEDLEDYSYKILESYSMGFSIVVACIQLMILNDWKGFKFSEEFEGIKCLIVK